MQLPMTAFILKPANKLPDPSDPNFNDYGNKEIKQLANFYDVEIEVRKNSNHPLLLMLNRPFQNGQFFTGFCRKKKSL